MFPLGKGRLQQAGFCGVEQNCGEHALQLQRGWKDGVILL